MFCAYVLNTEHNIMKNRYSLKTVKVGQLLKDDSVVTLQLLLNRHSSLLKRTNLMDKFNYQFELPICYLDRAGHFIVVANFLHFLKINSTTDIGAEIQVLLLNRRPPESEKIHLQYLLHLLITERCTSATSSFLVESMKMIKSLYTSFFGGQFKLNRRRLNRISNESEDTLRKHFKRKKQ